MSQSSRRSNERLGENLPPGSAHFKQLGAKQRVPLHMRGAGERSAVQLEDSRLLTILMRALDLLFAVMWLTHQAGLHHLRPILLPTPGANKNGSAHPSSLEEYRWTLPLFPFLLEGFRRLSGAHLSPAYPAER